MAKTKRSIGDHIWLCRRRQWLDTRLAAWSCLLSVPLLSFTFHRDWLLLIALLLIACLVHTVSALYCKRVWNVRVLRWESLYRRCASAESFDALMASTSGQQRLSRELAGTPGLAL